MDTIYKLIDKRNEPLWQELISWRDISIEYHDHPWYSCFTSPHKISISLNRNIISPGGFTHELLHILLYRKQFFASRKLDMLYNGSEFLPKFMSHELVSHIGNCIDHIKMLPLYLKMGYEWNEFISDSLVDKIKQEEIDNLRNNLKIKGVYDAAGVDFFIGKYFACKSCPNPNIGNQRKMSALKSISPDLYAVLDTFVSDVNSLDLDKDDPFNSYSTVVFDFVDSLEKWHSDNIMFNEFT